MLCALVLLIGLVAACVIAWPKIRAGRDAADPPAAPGAAAAPDRSPQTLEGVLALQIVAGEISPPQYRQAMATLAARDAERHPLEVPPDATPPEAA